MTAIPAATARSPFSREVVDVIEALSRGQLSFRFAAGRSARADASLGAKILSSATTVGEARWLEARGVDAVIAQGIEAGGHRAMFLSEDLDTQLGTFALVPQIVQSVGVPVIAAGGIADAKGVAAAMALGAVGVQVGTAYLLCAEATTSAVHRAALKSEAARTAAITNIFTGRPARGIVNRIIRELDQSAPPLQPFHSRPRRWRRCAQEPKVWAAAISLRCGPDRIPAAARSFGGESDVGAGKCTRRCAPERA